MSYQDRLRSLLSQKAVQAQEVGRRFLAENGLRPEVVTTASGLQYEILETGTGAKPSGLNAQVTVHYEGRLLTGTIIDSSYKRNKPAEFVLRDVIAGWQEGLQLMPEGAKYRFFIPYELGYGVHGVGSAIPPYATLIFDVVLLAAG